MSTHDKVGLSLKCMLLTFLKDSCIQWCDCGGAVAGGVSAPATDKKGLLVTPWRSPAQL